MAEPRDKIHNHAGRLFQARMWREYAMAYDGLGPSQYYGTGDWVAWVIRKTKAECIRQARVNLYLAKRLRRRM